MAQQAGLHQGRNRRQHPAPADRRGRGETRLPFLQRPQAGQRPPGRVACRPALRRLRVALVAPLLVGRLPHLRLRRLAPGRRSFRCRPGRRSLLARDPRQQAFAQVRPQRRIAQPQLPRRPAQARSLRQLLPRPPQQLRILDPVQAPPLARLVKVLLSARFHLSPRPGHRARADPVRPGQFGVRGQPEQREAAEAARAAWPVVDAAAVDRVGVEEIDPAASVQEHAQASVDGDRLTGPQAERSGEWGGFGVRWAAFHVDILKKPNRPCQARDTNCEKNVTPCARTAYTDSLDLAKLSM